MLQELLYTYCYNSPPLWILATVNGGQSLRSLQLCCDDQCLTSTGVLAPSGGRGFYSVSSCPWSPHLQAWVTVLLPSCRTCLCVETLWEGDWWGGAGEEWRQRDAPGKSGLARPKVLRQHCGLLQGWYDKGG